MMGLDRYTQVCYVVHDLEKKVQEWVGMGAGPFFVLDSSVLPERTYRGVVGYDHFLAAHGFCGNTQIELIQPTTDEPSLYREVLDRKGESIHHLQTDAGIIDAAAFDARAMRYTNIGLDLVHSLHVPGMGRIVYFDGLESFGHFFELAERPPHIFQNSAAMYEAHLGWDGTDPIRSNQVVALASSAA